MPQERAAPNLEGEAWLLRGGLGGYARYIAICPPDWKYGLRVGEVPEAPLARQKKPLHWDTGLGVRVR